MHTREFFRHETGNEFIVAASGLLRRVGWLLR